jgi:hypothetical protein
MVGPAFKALLLVWAVGGPGGPGEEKTAEEQFAQAVPACPETAETCLGIALFVTQEGKAAAVTPEWIAAQVARANLLLEPLGVALEVSSVELLPPEHGDLHTRDDRDALGAKRWKNGAVNLFVVERADDVDQEGEIYGVHWRWRKNTSRRWIILTSEAWPYTLGHELGHYFGLPHCDHPGSIMNKTGHDTTEMADRRFAEKELATMRKRLAAKLKSKELIGRARPAPAR